jgi:chromosome segregation ATPase
MVAEARAADAERRASGLAGALESAEAREGALSSELYDTSSAVQEAAAEAAAAHAAAADARRERDEARARVARLEGKVEALSIECEALRRSGNTAEGTNQALVDNMCDMTGLIDAVAALQQRNRLLEEETEAAAVRAARAKSSRDATALEVAAVERQLSAERERLAATAAAHEILAHGHDALRGDHVVATKQLEALEEAHGRLREEHEELRAVETGLRGAAAAAAEKGRRLRDEADRLAQELAAAQEAAAVSQVELQEALAEREAGAEREAELRGRAAEADKARSLAEGKLILAKQREAKLQVRMLIRSKPRN